MATAHDVAAYILGKCGRMTTMKLEKLLYYAQAWSLVWDDKPLFSERIEAWANGPVVRDIYQLHRGEYEISQWPKGDPDALTPDERDSVDAVLEYYGDRSSQWLSDLTHSESPWRDARHGLAPGQQGRREITHAAMAEYYEGLTALN